MRLLTPLQLRKLVNRRTAGGAFSKARVARYTPDAPRAWMSAPVLYLVTLTVNVAANPLINNLIGKLLSFSITTIPSLIKQIGKILAATTPSYLELILGGGPQDYWRLDDGGATAVDQIGAAHNGTLHGGITTGVAGALSGDSDTAMALDGANGSFIDSTALGTPAAWSMECWVKPNGAIQPANYALMADVFGSTAVAYVLIGQATGGFNSIIADGPLDIRAGVYSASQHDPGWLNSPAPITLTDAVWNYVVATWDGAIVTLYFNGSAINTFDNAFSSTSDGIGFRIAKSWDTTTSTTFKGSMDEVAFYTKALTPAQVQLHYVVGSFLRSSIITKRIGKAVAITVTTLPVTLRSIGKIIVGATTTTPAIFKQAGKLLAATTTTAPVVVAGKIAIRVLSVVTTTIPSLVKQIGKLLATSTTPGTVLLRQIGKILAVSTSPGVALLRTLGKPLSVTTTTIPSLIKQVQKRFTIATTTAPAVIKQIGKLVSLSTTTNPILTSIKAKFLTLAVTTTTNPLITKRIGKALTAITTVTAFLAIRRVAIVVLSVTTAPIAFVGSFIRRLALYIIGLPKSPEYDGRALAIKYTAIVKEATEFDSRPIPIAYKAKTIPETEYGVTVIQK